MSDHPDINLPNGWFAAGQPLIEALELLSDGAFKLFVYICLQADRSTGRMTFSQKHLAGRLRKSRRSISTYLDQLRLHGLCRTISAANQYESGQIEIQDPFWPYSRIATQPKPDPESDYIQKVAHLMVNSPGVESCFSPADRHLAARFYQEGIPVQTIQKAIVLGCARKHVSWLNGNSTRPIASFHYFEPIVAEVAGLQVSDDYWRYTERSLEKFHQKWTQENACAKLAQPITLNTETR